MGRGLRLNREQGETYRQAREVDERCDPKHWGSTCSTPASFKGPGLGLLADHKGNWGSSHTWWQRDKRSVTSQVGQCIPTKKSNVNQKGKRGILSPCSIGVMAFVNHSCTYSRYGSQKRELSVGSFFCLELSASLLPKKFCQISHPALFSMFLLSQVPAILSWHGWGQEGFAALLCRSQSSGVLHYLEIYPQHLLGLVFLKLWSGSWVAKKPKQTKKKGICIPV